MTGDIDEERERESALPWGGSFEQPKIVSAFFTGTAVVLKKRRYKLIAYLPFSLPSKAY